MTKNDFINSLNKIYSELEDLPGDSSLKQATHDLDRIKDKLGDIIQDFEDNGIELDEVEEDKE